MEQNYKAYEYMAISVRRRNALETANRYESLGWQLEKQEERLLGKIDLIFRRDRSIKSKEQLNRLQLRIEDGINGIEFWESSKTKTARTVSIVLGIIGTLTLGGGMSLCMLNDPKIGLEFLGGLGLGIVGLAICGISALLYKIIANRRTAKANTLIAKKREEIADLCMDAHHVVSSSN